MNGKRKTKRLFISLLMNACIMPSVFYGQVTIGSFTAPQKVSLLELKSQDGGRNNVTSETGGLRLPPRHLCLGWKPMAVGRRE